MTREEIIQLARDEVARALVHAAKAVIEMSEEPRRDRPARLSGVSPVQQLADEVAGKLPLQLDDAGQTELERRVMEIRSKMRREGEELAAELAKLTPEEQKRVRKGTTAKRKRELLQQVKRERSDGTK